MKQGRDIPTKILLQNIKLHRPIPDSLSNRPQVWPWLVVFYNAFTDLCGERGWEYGPIRWTAKQQWARTYRLDDVATKLLHRHTTALDVAFLQWKRDTAAKQKQSGGNGNSPQLQRSNRRTS